MQVYALTETREQASALEKNKNKPNHRTVHADCASQARTRRDYQTSLGGRSTTLSCERPRAQTNACTRGTHQSHSPEALDVLELGARLLEEVEGLLGSETLETDLLVLGGCGRSVGNEVAQRRLLSAPKEDAPAVRSVTTVSGMSGNGQRGLRWMGW